MDRFSEVGPLNRAFIHPDDREPFFTDAMPCELCGEPCDERIWHDDFALNIGTACSCTYPDLRMCPDFAVVLDLCETGEEVLATFKAHLLKCLKCSGVVELPVPPVIDREAA